MRRPSLNPTVLLLGGLFLLLAGAAFSVYRGIDRLAEAEYQRQREFLERALHGFQADFNGILLEVISTFRSALAAASLTDPEADLREFFLHWQQFSPQGGLLRSAGLGLKQGDRILYRRLEEGRFQSREWPEPLQRFRALLQGRPEDAEPFLPAFAGAPGLVVSGDPAILVFPILNPPRNPAEGPGRAPFGRGGPRTRFRGGEASRPNRIAAWCFLELDGDYLRRDLLSALRSRHFGGQAMSDYQLAVLDEEHSVLYQSDPDFSLEGPVDARLVLALFGTPPGFRAPRFPRSALPSPPEQFPQDLPPLPRSLAWASPGPPRVWYLVARHPAGSLSTFLRRERFWNLTLAFALLLVLAAGMTLLVVNTQRARLLARRQMEFVAGVSHEIRTPLAVLQSAGFNLARGTIEDPDRAREYGNLIQKESRRLSEMLERVLHYAGIQSGRKTGEFAWLDLSPLLQEVLEEYQPRFQEGGWTVERDIDDPLPRVQGDPSWLRSALQNLLDNAIKYAWPGKWLRLAVKAMPTNSPREVRITVEDKGPGFNPEDLPHLLEPFYRGRKFVASPVPGTGLGLSLVRHYLEAHGGRVKVENSPRGGAQVTLCLPVSPNRP